MNGDGREHRNELFGTRAGGQFYEWLVANSFPDDRSLQVLCLPCNKSKGTGDACRLDHDAIVGQLAGGER